MALRAVQGRLVWLDLLRGTLHIRQLHTHITDMHADGAYVRLYLRSYVRLSE